MSCKLGLQGGTQKFVLPSSDEVVRCSGFPPCGSVCIMHDFVVLLPPYLSGWRQTPISVGGVVHSTVLFIV